MRFTMKVDGMSCANCAKTIENTFQALEHISARVNVSAGRVTFEYDEKEWNITSIADMVRQAGYIPVLELDSESMDKHNHSTDTFRRDIKIAILLTIPLLWTMWHHFGATWMTPKLSMFLSQPLVQFVLATPVQFFVGRIFYKGFIKNARQKVLGMDALVVLGTTSAYLFSMYEWLAHGKIWYDFTVEMMPGLYFETSATIITVILIGNFFEHLAKSRTSDALMDLINLGAKRANVLRDGVVVEVAIEEVEKGDLVVVRNDEKIPVDGIVVEGGSFVDESMISGESIPVYKELHSEVIGGTMNQSGRLVIETTKIGADTVLAKIIETVEEVSASKPPIQRTADVISSIFVPIVVSISIGTFVVWYFFLNGTLFMAFEAAVAVLVISCPCALGLATPTSILVGSGKAAKEGILYKGGEFFEVANKVNAVCFDKTGTLTVGKPQVTDYLENEPVFDYIYSLELMSVHPLSKAVVDYQSGNELEVQDFENVRGFGLKGSINGHVVLVGSKRLMVEEQVNIDIFSQMTEKLELEAKTITYAAVDGTVQAIFGMRDELKKSTKQAIAHLHERGIETYMITGDNERVAQAIAKQAGIKNVFAEVLPQDKAEIVLNIKNQGKFVAFVGDGINDAPALKAAEVGIAMGSGSDIAIDSSDVTLMTHELNLVSKAIDISKATLKNIYQNFGWAFGYNIIAIPLAAMGKLDPLVAGVAMAFSDVTVVLNALRLKRFKFQEIEEIDELETIETIHVVETKASEMNEIKVKEELEMAQITVKVPDMACGHCVMTIEKALKGANIAGKVDLPTKTVAIEAADLEAASAAIEDSGYHVEQ